ncbi:MAG: PQQ-binding-like beta-propeller repeat protein [Dehalococcoidia bacterium]
MPRGTAVLPLLLAVALALGAACSDEDLVGLGKQPHDVGAAIEAATPIEAIATSTPDPAAEAVDWSTANGDLRNTRARVGGIDRSNVAALEVAWEHSLRGVGPYGAAAGAPVVVDGVVYAQDLASNVYAVDLEDGTTLWTHVNGVPISGPNGPAVADGRVFSSVGVARFEALDAASGEELWSIDLDRDGFQPSVAGDTVYVGVGAFSLVGGNSGKLYALDAASGAIRWVFQVVEDGFWGDPTLNAGGGVWYPPAIDEERGLVMLGTGNPGPYPGTRDFPNATSRPGPNLYTSSLVALDAESGELEWYFQAVEHDLFDHDLQLSPVLASIPRADGPRDVVIAAGKVGRVYALDADSGEVLWQTAVGRHLNDNLEELPLGQLIEVYPGIYGGVETPMAVANGLVFVPVVNIPTYHSATGHGAADGSSALLNAATSSGFSGGSGELVVLDVASGRVVWQRTFDRPNFGGATAIGDLVFTATYDGTIYAFRQTDGELLWTYEAGGGINAWPAIEGDTLIWPIGLGPRPRLIAFRPAS